MSSDQSFSPKKVALAPGGSPCRNKTPSNSTDSSPKSSPSKSATSKLSLRVLGRSSTCTATASGEGSGSKSSKSSPQVKRQTSVLCEEREPAGHSSSPSHSGHKDRDKRSKSPRELGEFIPGRSGPAYVDQVPSNYHEQQAQQCQSSSSPKPGNKTIHNWKSACKDKTKDLIRRWKTLPESEQNSATSSPSASFDRSNSPSALRESSIPVLAPRAPTFGSTTGNNTNIFYSSAPVTSSTSTTAVTATTSTSSSSATTIAGGVESGNSMVNPSDLRSGQGSSSGGGGGGGAAKDTTGSGSGSSTFGKFTKKKAPDPSSSSSAEISSRVGALSLNNTSAAFGNGPMHPHDDNGGSKSSTGWSVHVWATYVQRGIDDEAINEDQPPARDFLSDFQKVKLTHFFSHVLDMNHDDVISAEDFVALNQRIRHYIEWSSECIEFHILKEVHSGFLECFLNQPLDDSSGMYYCNAERETRQNVNIDEWLDVWGSLLHTSRTLESLPLWLQYFPKILFQVINKSGSGTISKEELRAFYTMFLGIDFRVVNETLDSIHNAMTDNGRNKMTYTLFKLCFTNFLLGKYPHGPGQYLFGICAPATLACPFPIDYSALNTPKEDLEPYDPEKDKGQTNRRLK